MSKPSLVLPKKAQPQEQELAILQTSITQAKRSWDDQKRQIAEDKQVTITTTKQAITEAIAVAKEELVSMQEKVRIAQKQFNRVEKEYGDTILSLEQYIASLEDKKMVLSRTHITLEEDNRTLESKISINNDTLDKLRSGVEALTAKFTDISIEKQQVETDFSKLEADYAKLQTDFTELQDKNDTAIKQYSDEIVILEKNKQDLVQGIIQQQQEDEILRKQLASWAKQLDERDKNLRIRESQVNEQEKSIARNYNLLNL